MEPVVDVPPKEKEEMYPLAEPPAGPCYFLKMLNASSKKKSKRFSDVLAIIFEWLIIAAIDDISYAKYSNLSHRYLARLGMTCRAFRRHVQLYRKTKFPKMVAEEKQSTIRKYGDTRRRKRAWANSRKRLQARNNLMRMIIGTFAEKPEFEQVKMIIDDEAKKRTQWGRYKLRRSIEMARFPMDKRIIAMEGINAIILEDDDGNQQIIDLTTMYPSKTVFQIIRGSDQFIRMDSNKFRYQLETTIQRWLQLGMIGSMFARRDVWGKTPYQFVESKVVYKIENGEAIFYLKL